MDRDDRNDRDESTPNLSSFYMNDNLDLDDEREEQRRSRNQNKQRETIRAKRKFQRTVRG